MTEPIIRIILADDHQMIRESWRMLLENDPQIQVVADCANGAAAILSVREFQPDIILVDINMYPMNGFEVTRQLSAEHPGIRIIGMSVNNQPKYASRMMELGAKGYLTKTSPLEEIRYGIREVFLGREYICDEVRKHLPPAE